MWWLTTGIFTVTYAGLAVGKYPKLRIDRAGIAFVGAAAMLCTGVMTLAQATAPESIDYSTLMLLFGMMVVVGAEEAVERASQVDSSFSGFLCSWVT